MIDFMDGMNAVFGFLSELASEMVSVFFSWQALAVAVVMPLAFYVIYHLVSLFQSGSSFDFNSFSGFLKSFSGKNRNRLSFSVGSKRYKRFSSFVVDGKRFYRNNRRQMRKKRN